MGYLSLDRSSAKNWSQDQRFNLSTFVEAESALNHRLCQCGLVPGESEAIGIIASPCLNYQTPEKIHQAVGAKQKVRKDCSNKMKNRTQAKWKWQFCWCPNQGRKVLKQIPYRRGHVEFATHRYGLLEQSTWTSATFLRHYAMSNAYSLSGAWLQLLASMPVYVMSPRWYHS